MKKKKLKKKCPACKNPYKGWSVDTPNLCKYHKSMVEVVFDYAKKNKIYPDLPK